MRSPATSPAADGNVHQEEARMLEMIRHQLSIERPPPRRSSAGAGPASGRGRTLRRKTPSRSRDAPWSGLG